MRSLRNYQNLPNKCIKPFAVAHWTDKMLLPFAAPYANR